MKTQHPAGREKNMTLLKRIEDVRQLWTILMPHVPQPEDRIFGNWAIRFSDDAIEAGIVRGSKKFSIRKTEAAPIDAENVHRYVSGVIRNQSELQKEQKAMNIEEKKQLVIAASVKYPELGEVAGRHAVKVLDELNPSGDFETDVDNFASKLIKAGETAEFEAHLAASTEQTDPIRMKARKFVNQHGDHGTLQQLLSALAE
jgi:hypothetical protein